MQSIKLWAELHEIYKATNRSSILKNNGHGFVFYFGLVIYLFVSACAFFFRYEWFFFSIFAIFLTAMSLGAVFVFVLSRDYGVEIKKYPLFERSRYIRLIEFKRCFDASENLKPEIIPKLLEWEEVRGRKFDTLNFFTNPLVLVVLSALLSQIFNVMGASGKEVETLLILFYLFAVVVFICWFAYDFFSSSRKRNFEICRLLHWLKIEYQTKEGDGG